MGYRDVQAVVCAALGEAWRCVEAMGPLWYAGALGALALGVVGLQARGRYR